MTDANDHTTSLREQLAAHRGTLAVLLHQRASLGADYAPPGVHNGIAKARREIAQLKAALRAVGVAVEDQAGDEATPGEAAAAASAEKRGVRQAIDPTQALRLLDALPLDQIPDPAPLPLGSRMPLSANPLFVGREDDLKVLATTLKSGTTTVIAAATGMGGIGKTQLASEFVHRYGQYFAGGVFWLSFAEAASVGADIAACGMMLELPGFAELEFHDQVLRVLQLWQEAAPRLLVFDNCEDEELLRRYRPSSGGCRVLVTSRRQRWDDGLGVRERRLGTLPRPESIALLRKFLPDLSEDDRDLDALAHALGDLPLALHVAGSYLKRYQQVVSPAQYLEKLQSAPLQAFALRAAGSTPTAHERDVALTVTASYQRLNASEQINALALLARAACFAPGEPIPRELLESTLDLASLPADERTLAFEDALIRLDELGLSEMAEDGALRLHRLVAAFVLSVGGDDGAQMAVEQSLTEEGHRRVNAGFPARLLPILAHLRHAMAVADPRGDAQAGALANALGRAEMMLVNYTAARPLYERALSICELALGPQHPATATSLNNLASLLESQGNYPAARPLYERALSIREQALGPQHPSTAISLNNLAGLLESQGDYPAARPLYERALSIREQALGPLHPATAISLNNLAGLLESQGDYPAARPLYEHALQVKEQVLGPLHPSTAISLNNLALLLKSQGDYPAARPLYERVVQIFEQALGPLHPATAISLNNLASLLQDQGDYPAARPLYERALSIREQTLGPLHPSTATSLNNLADLLRAQGDYPAARPLYERALQVTEQALGPLHPSTATCLNNLALLLKSQGNYPAAHPLYERALQVTEQALGPLHPSTATSLNNLATLLHAQGDYLAARPLFERALNIREQALGSLHPDTAQSLSNLAGLLLAQGDYLAAHPLYERALAICEQRLGTEHPTTRIIRANLGALDTPPPSAAQQIAGITAQFEAAVAAALADPSLDRAALAAQLEERARWAENGEQAGSPYLDLAAHLRALGAQVGAPPADELGGSA